MSLQGFLQIAVYLTILLLSVKPLGTYMAGIYMNQPGRLNRWLTRFENALYRLCGIDACVEMRWTQYAASLLVFNFLGF